jgi:hypothetical protein
VKVCSTAGREFGQIVAVFTRVSALYLRVRAPTLLPRFRHFPRVFPAKRLDLQNLKGLTKAEELGVLGPKLLSLRLPLDAL